MSTVFFRCQRFNRLFGSYQLLPNRHNLSVYIFFFGKLCSYISWIDFNKIEATSCLRVKQLYTEYNLSSTKKID